jgi:hypothetical protein
VGLPPLAAGGAGRCARGGGPGAPRQTGKTFQDLLKYEAVFFFFSTTA